MKKSLPHLPDSADSSPHAVADRIKLLREHIHSTQKEFADRLGLSQTYLSTLESGKRPLSDTVVRLLATTAQANPDWLLHGTPPMMFDEDMNASFLAEAQRRDALDSMRLAFNLDQADMSFLRSFSEKSSSDRKAFIDAVGTIQRMPQF